MSRAEIPFHRQAIMDRAYLRRRSLLVDLKLLAQTVPAVIGGQGAAMIGVDQRVEQVVE